MKVYHASSEVMKVPVIEDGFLGKGFYVSTSEVPTGRKAALIGGVLNQYKFLQEDLNVLALHQYDTMTRLSVLLHHWKFVENFKWTPELEWIYNEKYIDVSEYDYVTCDSLGDSSIRCLKEFLKGNASLLYLDRALHTLDGDARGCIKSQKALDQVIFLGSNENPDFGYPEGLLEHENSIARKMWKELIISDTSKWWNRESPRLRELMVKEVVA